jgi:D-aminopeptidase
VAGVLVGHQTVWRGDAVRTGVTVVVPHGDNLFQQKVVAAIECGNGFGKLAGSTQVAELGNLETPIALTNTLNVPTAVRALVRHTLGQPGNEDVGSVNAVVGETNDGFLNDIRGMHVSEADVVAALQSAAGGAVAEGAVGAGTGTVCFGCKGGIGTSSRRLPGELGGYTVGVLVQTNYGGILTINGAPVGRELGNYWLSQYAAVRGDGSCMIVVATDAPLCPRNLGRLAKRALFGLARTGSIMSNGSGDYVIAFSTTQRVVDTGEPEANIGKLVTNSHISPLFLAVVEATEEAVYNSLFQAKTVTGRDGHTVEALPVERVLEVCAKYNVLLLQDRLPGIGKRG